MLEDNSNPDRVRQALTSLVELIDHALRLAAPDRDVTRWTRRPEHYTRDGNPTRAARWAFLTRDLGEVGGLLSAFLEADLDEMLGLLKQLQGGKHCLEQSLSLTQADMLLVRAHGVARTIVIVWKIGRG